jgi:hypothetical protein
MTMGLSAREQFLPEHESPPSVPRIAPTLAEMTEWIGRLCPTSGASALRELRAAFPEAPLTLRVAALNTLIRRQGGTTAYIPR